MGFGLSDQHTSLYGVLDRRQVNSYLLLRDSELIGVVAAVDGLLPFWVEVRLQLDHLLHLLDLQTNDKRSQVPDLHEAQLVP